MLIGSSMVVSAAGVLAELDTRPGLEPSGGAKDEKQAGEDWGKQFDPCQSCVPCKHH